jgi:NhaP-type Na+/H+ or K+/H+ antiporter
MTKAQKEVLIEVIIGAISGAIAGAVLILLRRRMQKELHGKRTINT